jgi:hypothetical protein
VKENRTVTYNGRLQELFHEYERQLGKPGTLHDAIDWGLANGKIVKPDVDPKAVLIRDMRNALRAETCVDDDGREYRTNAAVTFTKGGGVQESFWASVDLKTTPHEFLEEHLSQRRKGIVDDCVKYKADLDHCNNTHRDMKQLPLMLDFTDDVAERESAIAAAQDKKDAA